MSTALPLPRDRGNARIVHPEPPVDAEQKSEARPSLLAQLREDLAHHGGSLASPGFRAVAIYRFGVWRKRVWPAWLGKLLRVPYSLLRRRVQNRYGIELHHTGAFGRRLRLSDQGGIVIGNPVRIGDDCFIGQGVTIGKTGHGGVGWPTLGDRVVVGPGAVVIGKIHVGSDAVIGPNTVVMSNIPAAAVVSPRPAEISTNQPDAPEANNDTASEAGGFANPRANSRTSNTLWQTLREDWQANGRSWTSPAMHALGVYRLRRRTAASTSSFLRLADHACRVLETVIRNVHQIEVPVTAAIGRGVRLARKGRISIGRDTVIGNETLICEDVVIGWQFGQEQSGARIGERVRIAPGAVVLAGVKVGNGAVIGFNAVVTRDVPEGAEVTAPAAKVLRPMHTSTASPKTS